MTTYKEAGVDIDAANTGLSKIKKNAQTERALCNTSPPLFDPSRPSFPYTPNPRTGWRRCERSEAP